MPTLERSQLAAVALPSEAADVPELGGTVIVQGLTMPQLLRFAQARRQAMQPRDAETEADAAERAGAELAPLLLSMCVVVSDGLPAYTAQQWAVLGGRHPQAVLDLWAVAVRLSGQDAAAEKKT